MDPQNTHDCYNGARAFGPRYKCLNCNAIRAREHYKKNRSHIATRRKQKKIETKKAFEDNQALMREFGL